MLDENRRKRAAETEARLESLRVAERRELTDVSVHATREFLDPADVRGREFTPCSVGFTWERDRQTMPDDRRTAEADVVTGDVSTDLAVGQNVWFRLQFTIPESMAGHPVFLKFVARPRDGDGDLGSPRVESLCFRDGVPWQAFDNGHESLRLTDEAEGGEEYDLLVEAGTTTLWGSLDVEEFVLQAAEIYAERPAVADLHRHVSVCTDLCEHFDEESPNRGRLLNALVEASHAFPFEAETEAGFRDGAARALEILEGVETDVTSDLTGQQLTAVGHAHIDLAWMWPWSETIRKAGRSFSNVLRLMEEYPDVTFTQSQPHMYEWARNRYPDQFETIEDYIEEGRWLPEGALWVESDINNVGQESLARQFLRGKRFFREEFGVDPEVTFIPDVFGYSAGLPGIARAAGCPYFLTQKMSWNEINDFPHNTFRWEGIDGSEVLAHFPPVDTYSGEMSVEEVTRSVYNDSQNDRTDDRAYLVGWGDGGGGPTREMVERGEVLDGIDALPDVAWGSLAGLFDRLDANREAYPQWTGELYLEKHRGTLTTQAQTKQNNRRGEYSLKAAEVWSSLAHAVADHPAPHDDLTKAWKVLLFNQFHDILPGSSVTDVYADADRDYEAVFETASTVRENALDALLEPAARSNRICFTNPLSWAREPTVTVAADDVAIEASEGTSLVAVPDASETAGGAERAVQRTNAGVGDAVATGDDALLVEGPRVPGFGAQSATVEPTDAVVTNPFDVSTDVLSNGLVTVRFDDGTLTVTDDALDRDVLDGGGNRLMLYRDHPRQWDAWDIDEDVYAVGDELPASEVEVVESGPVRATVRQTRRFGDSELTQDVSLYRGSKRVEFRTQVDWQEEEKLLKAHFPARVRAQSATYDTHFGHHERPTHDNTTWDQARHEEPSGQWVDVSESGFGVSVLNDCKYGVHVEESEISLSLLRAPDFPDPDADRGTHEFTYALLPHEGDVVEGCVEHAACELNAPAGTRSVQSPVSLSSITIDADGVIAEALKRAEDSEDRLVLRLYEAYGRHTTATVDLDLPIAGATETNLVEDDERELPVTDGRFDLDFDAFEIRTVALDLA